MATGNERLFARTSAGGAAPSSSTSGASYEAPDSRREGASEEFEEISLVDIVRVVHRRRILFVGLVVLSLVGGGALTAFTTPEFEAKTTIVALEHTSIIVSWLESRQAAEYTVNSLGGRLYAVLYPTQWDATREQWTGGSEPTRSEIALRLMTQVNVKAPSSRDSDQRVTVTATMTDAVVARDVAAAYLASLTVLRPQLEEITRAELFDKYYTGANEQEAHRRADTAAKQRAYWLVFDSPTVPNSAVKPKPMLNMALAGVLGVMLGFFAVFGAEWLGRYKADFSRVEPPLR